MTSFLNKFSYAGFLSLLTLSTNLQADCGFECNPCDFQSAGSDCCFNYNPCDCQSPQFYIGVFGGGGASANNPRFRQNGVAFFPEDVLGPLDVDARGHLKSSSIAIGGANIGYRLQPICSITPAIELEGFYLNRSKSKTNDLINDSNVLEEHDFIDKFRFDAGVFLVNGVFSFDVPCMKCFQPYLGGGVGVTKIWLEKAKSTQISPPEVGVNHFNSRTNDTDWAFAAQVKAGLKYNLSCRWSIFAEYRYLFIDSTTYSFGSTRYPNHVPTTNWGVRLNNMSYNLGVIGIQYSL